MPRCDIHGCVYAVNEWCHACDADADYAAALISEHGSLEAAAAALAADHGVPDDADEIAAGIRRALGVD